jgi:thiamine-monophosphate kinase
VNEFELIERYFADLGARRADVKLGVGDDAALLECPPGHELVATIDTLVEGRHFPQGSPPASIGHRALAVNLSDLAAMGASPAWALLALTLPRIEEPWLEQFASGFSRLACAHDLALVGGNTTAGPLCISVQLLGHVPVGKAMRRSGGRPGDVVFVSGTPGDAAAGLALQQGSLAATGDAAAHLRERFLYPTPRVALGLRLREFASACIDVSDGLYGDAGKLAAASGCGLQISYEDVPVSAQLLASAGDERARQFALAGGEDYELCFSAPPAALEALERALPGGAWGYRRIGALTGGSGHSLLRAGIVTRFSHSGFDHFGAMR